MSLELHAFLNKEKVPDRTQWQASITAIGLPLTLYPELDLNKDTGFSPSMLNGELSGFEIYPDDGREDLLSAYPHLSPVVGDRDYVISFRWGSRFKECACVLGAAAALAKDFGAIIYDPDGDTVCDIDTLLEEVRQCLSAAGESE